MRGLKVGLLMILFFNVGSFADEEEIMEGGHTINFNDVPVIEFIRFVSKISNVNFMFDTDELQFNVSLMSGKGVSSDSVLKALVQMLYARGLTAVEKDGYYVIFKNEDELNNPSEFLDRVVAEPRSGQASGPSTTEFFVYKLKYHQGAEIMDAMEKGGLRPSRPGRNPSKSFEYDPLGPMGEDDEFPPLFRGRPSSGRAEKIDQRAGYSVKAGLY